MAPKKRKTDASAPAAKKPRSNSSRSEKPRRAKEADLADIKPLVEEALAEIGDGDKNAADVATKINEILYERGEKLFEHKSLTSLLAPSRHGKALGIGKKEVDPYVYAGRSNTDLLSRSASDIAIVEESGADGHPTVFLDLTADYIDRRNGQGVPFRSERFAVADYGDDVELTREAARASALAKLVLRRYNSKPRHPRLMDDIEDEDFKEKVNAAREELLGRREFDRSGYGTGTHKSARPGLSHIYKRADGTEYVRFFVQPLRSEGLTYVIRPGHKEEDLDKAWTIARLASTGHCSLDRRAELKQAAEDLASGKKTIAELCGYFHTDEWKTEGHPLIGREIVTPDDDGPTNSEGRVVAWLSAAESDYLNDRDQPAALFHVQYTAGELEGRGRHLELHEVEAYLKVPDDDDAAAAVDEAASVDGADARSDLPAAEQHSPPPPAFEERNDNLRQCRDGATTALRAASRQVSTKRLRVRLRLNGRIVKEPKQIHVVTSKGQRAAVEAILQAPQELDACRDVGAYASRPSEAFAEESASPADAARNQWRTGPAGRARGRPKTSQLVEAAADAATKKLLGNLDSVIAQLASKGVNLTVCDLGGTGQLSGDDLRVYEALGARFATSGIDWRRTAFGPIDRDRRLRCMIVDFLGDAAPTPTAALSELLRSEAEGMKQWLESRYIRVPTRIEFCVPADAGELVGGARGLFPHAHALHLEALRSIGPFDYDRLKDEVNRLAFEHGLIHALVERRLGLALPKSRDGDDFVRTWWELDYLISGHQATAKGLVLRPRHFAAAWAGMVKHEEIALYYGAAAFAKAAAAVFHPSSLARMNERGGL